MIAMAWSAKRQQSASPQRLHSADETVVGLQELLTYGLKGTAAYADHARILGQEDEAVYAFFHEALEFPGGG